MVESLAAACREVRYKLRSSSAPVPRRTSPGKSRQRMNRTGKTLSGAGAEPEISLIRETLAGNIFFTNVN
jgi:hypothetical protein